MRISDHEKAFLIHSFEVNHTIPVKEWIKDKSITTDGSLYKWRAAFGIKHPRGHVSNIARAQKLLEKYQAPDPVQLSIPGPAPEPVDTPIFAQKGKGNRYPEEVKARVLAEYLQLIADGTPARNAQVDLNKKYGIGRGVIEYWQRAADGKKVKYPKKRKGTEVVPADAAIVTKRVEAQGAECDVKGAIIFLREAATLLEAKRPIDLSCTELLTLHAYRALLGKGRV